MLSIDLEVFKTYGRNEKEHFKTQIKEEKKIIPVV